MTTTALPLAVVDDIQLCDRADHEIRILTDGHRAHAYGLADGTEAGTGARDGSRITFGCQQPTGRRHNGEPCDGQVTTDLASSTTWTGDPETIRHFVAWQPTPVNQA